MANTAAVYARIDPVLKNEVDTILGELGVSPSSLIQMLYSQIRLKKGIPFEVKLPDKPVFIEDLTKEELNKELEKGLNDVKEDKILSSDEVDSLLKKELDI